MRIGIFQSNVSDLTPQQRLAKLASHLTAEPIDLIVCPELFMSGYNVGKQLPTLAEAVNGQFCSLARRLAKSTQTAIIYGYPETQGQDLYNAAVCIDKHGDIIANHRKLMLPPGFESNYFQAGDKLTCFELNGIQCALLVCFDAEFPETIRAAAESGAELIIIPTALSENWGVVAEKIMPARAFENGVWVAYANHAGSEGSMRYFGGSCIVNPVGQDIARAKAEEALIIAEINLDAVKKAQARLPYLKRVKQLRSLLP